MKYKEIDVKPLIDAALAAGAVIMEIYQSDFSVAWKEDHSPLTEADRASNEVIVAALRRLTPQVPVISEETRQTPFAERSTWQRFWLVDPLDGTKEFIKKNGEFTVNIALIEQGAPVLGVVYAPALSKCYVGLKGSGSFRYNLETGEWQTLQPKPSYKELQEINVVASRSHLSPETEQFVADLKAEGKKVNFISSGSSLKFCLVAEGLADVYPRFGPTMEWDTAAAHAVAFYAGKQVVEAGTQRSLIYNKENLLNPWFIVA